MWFCVVLSKSGKSYTTFTASDEGNAIYIGQVACVKSGGQQYYPVEIPDRTPQDKRKGVINRQLWEKYHIQLDDVGKRHYKQ